MVRAVVVLSLVTLASAASTSIVSAQSLGTFRWQTQPYCNVLTLAVIREAGVYRLEGVDDQCGAATTAPVTGTASPNADGTIQFAMTIVESPTGHVTHLSVPVAIATLGGTWTDGKTSSGTFRFTSSAGTGGPRRPVSSDVFAYTGSGLEVSALGGLTSVGLATNGRGGFDLSNNDGLVMRSNLTLNVPAGIPSTGSGRKMMWYPGKSAFRAGKVNGTQWDDAFIGDASVAFGENTTARGTHSVAMGNGTQAAGRASVTMGELLDVAGEGSVALGYNAGTTFGGNGSFVFGDRYPGAYFLQSLASNQFLVRAIGGTKFFTNASLNSGVHLATGASSWSSLSDVNSKEHFRDLDGADVLTKIARMPIREWNYKAQDAAIRHVGPTAQDFHAAFGLGEDPLRISTIDADGIALAAVQALEARTRADRDALARENAEVRAALAALQARLDALEHRPQ